MTNSGSAVSNGGYCKMGDGTLIQWGSVTVAAGAYVATISFPVEFVDRTQLSIQVTPLQSGTDWNVNYANTTTTKSSIGRTPNTGSDTYYWLAIGRWK